MFFGEDLGAGSFAGVGVGYQFNGWLRADVTGEYRFSKGFKVHDRINFDAGAGIPGVTHETTQGDFTSAVFLLNGYVDFGTWYGITPFVGAGAGFARNMLSGFSETSLTTIAGVTTPSGGWIVDGDKTHFAWALYAGLGYAVTPNLKLELGYRYLNLGKAQTGAGFEPCCTGSLQAIKVKDIEAHDVKIGLRYYLGGFVAAPLPPLMPEPVPGPLVRKY